MSSLAHLEIFGELKGKGVGGHMPKPFSDMLAGVVSIHHLYARICLHCGRVLDGFLLQPYLACSKVNKEGQKRQRLQQPQAG